MSFFAMRSPSIGLLVVGGAVAAVALGWSLAAYVWLAPVFAGFLAYSAWQLTLRIRHASDYAARLALAAHEVDSQDFQRPISDRAPQALDRLPSVLTEKNLQLVSSAHESLRNDL